jgi:hypothetical protein
LAELNTDVLEDSAMDVATSLFMLLAAGVNFGWQPAAGSPDGYEYIVQVEPELLDALQRGDAVPIESNIPPDVGPIRKVSVVVGRSELPQDTVSAVQRTAYFAGQSGWASDSSTPPPGSTNAPTTASAYDRYALPTNTTPSGVAPPPGVMERAQTAINETGTAIRDGVEAGIQAANQQFSQAGEQMIDGARNTGQEFGRQLQGMASDPVGQFQSNANSLRGATEQSLGTVGNQLQQVANPFTGTNPQAATTSSRTGNGVAPPPPWPQNSIRVADASALGQSAPPSTTPVRTDSAWTTINSNAAPPRLIIPQLATTATDPGVPQTRTTSGGPSFPASGDPTDGWGMDRGSSPATIGRAGNLPATSTTGQEAQLVPVERPQGQNPTASQPTNSGWDDLWARDPWGQTPQTSPPGQLSQDPRSNMPATSNAAVEWQTGTNSRMSPPSFPANQMQTGVTNNPSSVNTDPRGLGSQTPSSIAPSEQTPWLPLLIVSLSLVGSLSANLFLGWSYMDARQKYRSLVRKTADRFRRAAAA